MVKKWIFTPRYYLLLLTFFTGFTGCVDRVDPEAPGEHPVAVFHPLDRIIFQIDFADRISGISPEYRDQWSPLPEQAHQLLYNYVDSLDQEKILAAIEEADVELSNIRIYQDFIENGTWSPEPHSFKDFESIITQLNEMIRWSGQGRKNLLNAKGIVYDAMADKDDSLLIDLVGSVEKILEPIGPLAKTFTVHCVGHSHIDMNWLWPWEETVNITNETFTTMLNLMEEFPEFHFTQSQASVYEIIRENNPEMLEKIKKRVQEGRWEVAASQWVEGDKNMASGESLARHLLYTRRYLKEQLGLNPEDVRIDWEPDAFGHSLMLPAILSRGGVEHYYCGRAGVDANHKSEYWWKGFSIDRPSVFWWKSPDGSRILVNLEKESWYNETIDIQRAVNAIQLFNESGLKDIMAVYGVGDHGGGPTRTDILKCLEMNTWPVFPEFVMTTTEKYFDVIKNCGIEFPEVNVELNPEFTGCLTSQSQIKKFNRYGENKLYDAEYAAILASQLLGKPYPTDRLRHGWINILFSQFHDILPGSNVPLSVDYQSGLAQETFGIASMVQSISFRSITDATDTEDAFGQLISKDKGIDDWAYGAGAGHEATTGEISNVGYSRNRANCAVLFNPLPRARNNVVKVTLWDFSPDFSLEKQGNIIVTGADGSTHPVQVLSDQGSFWAHRFIEVAIPATIPSFGYNSYMFSAGDPEIISNGARVEMYDNSSYCLENELISATIDPETGGISKLIVKSTGTDYASPSDPLATLEYIIEDGGNAWTIADAKEKNFPLRATSVSKGFDGPYWASVNVTAPVDDSEVLITYRLAYNSPIIEIDIELDWKEIGSQERGTPNLRMVFPLPFIEANATYEIPYGSLKRSENMGEEVPALRWANVDGKHMLNQGPAGMLLLNDCKYGHSLDGSTLKVTLIRSTFYPDPYPEMGTHQVRLALIPHGQEIGEPDYVKLASDFSHSVKVINTDVHPGELPAVTGDFIQIEPENIVLTSVKQAEDGDGIILRLIETAGKNSAAKVKLSPDLFGKLKAAQEVDLIERPTGKVHIDANNNSIGVDVMAHGITTIKILH